MKYSEIISLSVDQRREWLQKEILNLKKLRFAHAITPLENPMKIKYSRRLIARLQTAEVAKAKMG